MVELTSHALSTGYGSLAAFSRDGLKLEVSSGRGCGTSTGDMLLSLLKEA
jgi:hypothetical protein